MKPKALRVALIASNRYPIRQPFAGGLEAHVWHLAHALGKDGHEVTLVSERKDHWRRDPEIEYKTPEQVALYGGTALVALWLVALAAGPAAYGWVAGFFGSVFGKLILFAYTWVLMHHMLGGVRHLVWDFGHGMEPGQRINMARFTLIGSIALTLAIWVVAFIAF